MTGQQCRPIAPLSNEAPRRAGGANSRRITEAPSADTARSPSRTSISAVAERPVCAVPASTPLFRRGGALLRCTAHWRRPIWPDSERWRRSRSDERYGAPCRTSTATTSKQQMMTTSWRRGGAHLEQMFRRLRDYSPRGHTLMRRGTRPRPDARASASATRWLSPPAARCREQGSTTGAVDLMCRLSPRRQLSRGNGRR